MLLISGQTPLTNRSWQKEKKKNNSGKHTSMCNTMSHHRTNNFVEKSRVSDCFSTETTDRSSPNRYPTRIVSHNHYHDIGICVRSGDASVRERAGCPPQQLLSPVVIFTYFTDFMRSTSAAVLQSLRYAEMKST